MFTQIELDNIEDAINEAIESYLDSGYKVTDEYVVSLRSVLRKLNLKEYWDYDKKYGRSDVK